MDTLPAVARVAAEERSGRCNITNQLLRRRVLSRPAPCLSRRWHPHRHGSHSDRPELCGRNRPTAGVIGPLLAVPLTATLKVLFGRYVWGRHLRERSLPSETVLTSEEIEVPTHR